MGLTVKQALSQLTGMERFLTKDPQLLSIASGFFVFPVRKGRCATALGLAVPAAPHASKLFVVGAELDRITGPSLPFEEEKGVVAFDVAGKRVSADGRSPSAARIVNGDSSRVKRAAGKSGPDFGLIPDFGSFCCGASLNMALLNEKTLQTRLDLAGGNMGGIRDSKTCDETWMWKNCRGIRHTQRVSSLAAHVSGPLPSLRIAVTPFDGKTEPTVIPIKPIPGLNLGAIALVHTPINPGNLDELTIDIAHLDANLLVCRKHGPITVQFGKQTKTKCHDHAASPSKVFESIGALFEKVLDVSIRNNGRPNCGARQMQI